MIMGFDCHVKDPKSLLSCWLCQLTRSSRSKCDRRKGKKMTALPGRSLNFLPNSTCTHYLGNLPGGFYYHVTVLGNRYPAYGL